MLLAGGFAKRMWPLTKDRPKALLPVAGKPIIKYILEKIELIKDIDLIYISTNKRFEFHFKEELNKLSVKKPIKLIIEPATKEEEKFGAIGALRFLIKKEKINEDLLVIAGDNLFDFSLLDFINHYKEKGAPIIAFYDMRDKEKVKEKYGVAVLDENNQIKEFQEKPIHPKSALVSTGCYLFTKEILKLILAYMNDKNNPDAPGYFINWLYQRKTVYGFVFKGKWFDVGSFDSYREANSAYEKRN